MKKKTSNWGLIFFFIYVDFYPLKTIKYLDPEALPAPLPDSHNEPVTKGSVVGKPLKSTDPVWYKDPVIVTLPVTSKDPVTECDPVKCLKLLSNSLIVKAEPLPPEPVL